MSESTVSETKPKNKRKTSIFVILVLIIIISIVIGLIYYFLKNLFNKNDQLELPEPVVMKYDGQGVVPDITIEVSHTNK